MYDFTHTAGRDEDHILRHVILGVPRGNLLYGNGCDDPVSACTVLLEVYLTELHSQPNSYHG